MKEHQYNLKALLEITEEINVQAQSIHTKMDDNDPECVETLQALVEKRQRVIQQLDANMKDESAEWTVADKEIIKQLKQLETTIQPILNKLYQSFLTQMNRLKQTKQASKKYINAYQTVPADGSYFDKRK